MARGGSVGHAEGRASGPDSAAALSAMQHATHHTVTARALCGCLLAGVGRRAAEGTRAPAPAPVPGQAFALAGLPAMLPGLGRPGGRHLTSTATPRSRAAGARRAPRIQSRNGGAGPPPLERVGPCPGGLAGAPWRMRGAPCRSHGHRRQGATEGGDEGPSATAPCAIPPRAFPRGDAGHDAAPGGLGTAARVPGRRPKPGQFLYGPRPEAGA